MLARLLASVAAGEMAGLLKRLKTSMLLYSIAGLVSLFGLFFLLLAAYVSAAEHWGIIPSALGFGIGFLVLAMIIIAAEKLWSRFQQRRARRRRASEAGLVAGSAALTLLPLVMSRTGGAGALALPLLALAGYALYRENRSPPGEQ